MAAFALEPLALALRWIRTGNDRKFHIVLLEVSGWCDRAPSAGDRRCGGRVLSGAAKRDGSVPTGTEIWLSRCRQVARSCSASGGSVVRVVYCLVGVRLGLLHGL